MERKRIGLFVQGEHEAGIFREFREAFFLEGDNAEGIAADGIEEEFPTIEKNPAPPGIIVVSFSGGDAVRFVTFGIAQVDIDSEGEPGAFTETVHEPQASVAAVIEAHVVDKADIAGFHDRFTGSEVEVVEESAGLLHGLGYEKGGEVKEPRGKEEAHDPEGATDPHKAEALSAEGDDLVVAVEVAEGKEEGNQKNNGQDQRKVCREGEQEKIDDLRKGGLCLQEVGYFIQHILQDQNPQYEAEGQKKGATPLF